MYRDLDMYPDICLDHAHVAHMRDIYLHLVIHMNDARMPVTHMNTSRHTYEYVTSQLICP